MWTLTKSRGRFQQVHAAHSVTESARYLGPFLPDGLHGNFAVLDEFLSAAPPSGNPGRNVDGVFCGVTKSKVTAENDVNAKVAWIAISDRYITALEVAAGLFLAYCDMLEIVDTVRYKYGPSEALRLLATARTSAVDFSEARQADRDFTGEDSDLWDQYTSRSDCADLAQSALLWTVCHELAHMTQGDKTKRVDTSLRSARMNMASRIPSEWWPRSTLHQDELIADWAGLDMAARSTHRAAGLKRLMPATVIAATALMIDGWHLDESALSESHPSPSLRVEALGCYWLEFLNRSHETTWADSPRPDDDALTQLALAITFGRWIAGRYREGREGLSARSDVEEFLWFAHATVGENDPMPESDPHP